MRFIKEVTRYKKKKVTPLAFGLLSSYYWNSTFAGKTDRYSVLDASRDEPEKMVKYWVEHLSDGRLQEWGVWGNGKWNVAKVRAVRVF